MKSHHIAFITCPAEKIKNYYPTKAEPYLIQTEPPFTPDDQLAVDYLRENGIKVSAVEWGTHIEELKGYNLVVMRSPWDYSDSDKSIINFMRWLNHLKASDIKVENHPRYMIWLADKKYLIELEREGVPIVPTKLVQDLDLIKTYANSGAFVIKASISAAGKNLFLIDSIEKAKQFQPEYNKLAKQKTFMLQPFIEEIHTNGEWSLVFIDGIYSHAIHKKPAPDSILVQAEKGGNLRYCAPPQNILKFAQQHLSSITSGYNPLYLRIDIIQTKHGPLLSECEGLEPELFFRAKAESVKIFYEGIVKRLK